MFTHYEDMKSDEKCEKWGGMGVGCHARSSETSPFDRSHYDFLFDFNRNYVSILYRFRVIAHFFVESVDFLPTPPAFVAPIWGWSHSNFAVNVGVRKLESRAYRVALFAWFYV